MRPKVSVAILTYNQRDYIRDAIESALMQRTDFDFEIRIGDDFSDDGTREILKDYRERYPGDIFLNLQPRRPSGIAGRVNNMANLASCRGDYVAIMDGDDYWTDPDKLQRQADALDADAALGGTMHYAVILDEDGRGAEGYPETVGTTSMRIGDLFCGPLPPSSSFMFRRSLIDPLPEWFESIPAGDLGLFALAAGADGGGIAIDPAMRSVYRRTFGSVTATLGREHDAARLRWRLLSFDTLHREFAAARDDPRCAIELARMRVLHALARQRWIDLAHSLARLFVLAPRATVLTLTRRMASAAGRMGR